MINKNHVFIIAEAGVNHNGSVDIAKKLIDAACEAGADAVKFQTFKAENLVTKNAPKAKYQKETTDNGSQFDMLKKLELSLEDHVILKKYCDKKNIIFLSTPFDFESVDLLEEVGIRYYKISSGDLTNIPLLEYIAKLQKPMIVSTGMANLGETEMAVKTINKYMNKNLYLLHCTSNYPASYDDVNLNAMITLRNAFKLPVGYSDHTVGIEIPIAAAALGAKIIEKHFTLDRRMKGPDHRASLEPDELKRMVGDIRNLERAFGDGIKRCNISEKNTKKVARKSIVAKTNLKKGQKLSFDNIAFKRPEIGIKPVYANVMIGKELTRNLDKDEIITFDLIK
jgi:N,N'-diacetyllegionaminate synthase